MPEIAINLEGQNGLNWRRWKRIVRAVEDLGFAALTRSDHYTNSDPPDQDSLELWISLTWLADNTKRIEFGPLVSPVSFRHPTMTARMASAVDDLSEGRLVLGIGAGWQQREHQNYGWDLLDVPARFQRFEEGLEVISRLLHSNEPVNFAGDYFQLHDAILLPRPARPGGPPILVGGNGENRTLPLAAKYADEWNGVFVSARRYAELNAQLDRLLVAERRNVADVRRSLMTGIVLGRTDEELAQKLEGRNQERLRERGILVGTPGAIAEQVDILDEAGVERLMIQWLDLDDMDGLEVLANTLL
ncbi:MAG: TIGR03560 family F420-dependent LLM class oxidoreductase [Caldilineaceae bacterium]|nr:TIGR03560 family F420-dependent LLM class oxidoreductase [Caldilineaceae bacterium]